MRRLALWLAPRLAWLLMAVALLAAPSAAGAVTFLEQAERLQHIYAFLLDLRPGQAPRVPREGGLNLTIEAIPMPEVDTRVGGKEEPVDTPGTIPRVRARYIGASGWMLGGTYNPPVEVNGFSAPWLGFELGYRFQLGGMQGALRIETIRAEVTGGITEEDAEDEFEMTNRAGDLRLGIPFGALNLYGGAGAGNSDSTLRVAADGAELEADTDYGYLFAGAEWAVGPLALTFEQHRTEDYLEHFILAAGAQW